MSHRSRILLASVSAIALFFVVLQTAVLPPEGFFSGDQGAKFLQTRAFAEHGLLHPGIEVRSRDIDPDYRYQILENRGGQLVGVFSWLLPMLGAPFVRLLGNGGMYVVPMLSALVIFLAAASLGQRLGSGTGVWSAWTAVLAAPVLFYGAELWEHAPAAAMVMLTALLLIPSSRASRGRFIAAGACAAIGALFREEAFLALPAFVIARAAALGRGERLRDAVKCGALATAGAAAVFLLAIPGNLLVYRSAVPLHLTTEIQKTSSYFTMRWTVLAQLLLPGMLVPVFVVAVLVAAGIAIVARRRSRSNAPWQQADSVLLGATLLCVSTLLIVAVFVPAWRVAVLGIPQFGAYSVDSIVHTWPFCAALLFLLFLSPEDVRWDVARFLGVGAVLLALGALAIIPSHGGAQWSPRYLFVAAPLLAVLAALPARQATGRIGARASFVIWGARVVLLCSVLAQVGGLFYLADAKARNARITERLASLAAPDDVVISDVPWFPQVTASLMPTRRILLAWSPAQVDEIATRAAERGFRQVSVVTSMGETHYSAPRTLDASAAGCLFTRTGRQSLAERALILHRYACESPPAGVVK